MKLFCFYKEKLESLFYTGVQQLSQLKLRLAESEAERDKLLEELKGSHVIGASDSEDMDEMLDFPGLQYFHRPHTSMCVSCISLTRQYTDFFSLWSLCLLEKLLSKRSRASPAHEEATSQTDSDGPSPAPADPGQVAELHKQIEQLTSQNSELALKVQVRSNKAKLGQFAHGSKILAWEKATSDILLLVRIKLKEKLGFWFENSLTYTWKDYIVSLYCWSVYLFFLIEFQYKPALAGIVVDSDL